MLMARGRTEVRPLTPSLYSADADGERYGFGSSQHNILASFRFNVLQAADAAVACALQFYCSINREESQAFSVNQRLKGGYIADTLLTITGECDILEQ